MNEWTEELEMNNKLDNDKKSLGPQPHARPPHRSDKCQLPIRIKN